MIRLGTFANPLSYNITLIHLRRRLLRVLLVVYALIAMPVLADDYLAMLHLLAYLLI